MTRAAHMPNLSWRGSLGKRTREAAELPWLAEYEREAELSKWQHERRETRRRELEEAYIEGSAAAEAEGAGDQGACWLCQGSIEGVVGALGCAEGVDGATGCAGRFCAACLPEIREGIAAGKLRSCPSCRRSEPPTGPGGAGASLLLCRNFGASRTFPEASKGPVLSLYILLTCIAPSHHETINMSREEILTEGGPVRGHGQAYT